MVLRVKERRGVEERERVVVCDVHGVACFKPEKKAKWKHGKTCSLLIFEGTCVFAALSRDCFIYIFFKRQVPSHQSASGSELKAARVTSWPLIQHRWTPMTRLNALLRLFPYREYWRCSSALLCVYGCYYNTGTTHKSPTLNLPQRVLWFIINSFDQENKYNWNANKRADRQHMHTFPHTLLQTYT